VSQEWVEPITENDEVIKKALEDAHLPSLILSLVHLTGETHFLSEIRPLYEVFGDGQGGLTEDQRMRVKGEALRALSAHRDHGGKLPPPPSRALMQKMMNFIAGAEIPERYVPFLEEELALDDSDTKAKHWGRDVTDAARKKFRVLIVGAGMSGILAAIRLKQEGIAFTIVDKNPDVGGTWFENTYPGCRVDNPNHLYSYSFEPNHDWPQHFSTQKVLHDYFRRVADKYELRDNTRFSTEVEECVYDEKRAMWQVHVRDPDGKKAKLEANAVISAVGQLNRPRYPDVKGRDTFKGPSFHSARWNYDIDLKGKRVAVIGTGASAFQFVPEIAPDVVDLFVFQRTPPWLAPTVNYHDDVTPGMKWLLRHVPYYEKWYRFWLFWTGTDGIYEAVKVDPAWQGGPEAVSAVNDELRKMLADYTKAQVMDRPDLVPHVVPNYPIGGKRAVRDNGVWLGALKRENVHVVTSPIAEITAQGLTTKDGTKYPVDVIIYGTGFTASSFLTPMKVKGKGGRDLHEEQWRGDARAYLGITLPGYPNFFIMYGPNTNIVVNGSIVFFSECEIHYIMGLIEMVLARGAASFEVKKEVHDVFNEKIDAANKGMAWGVPQVTSWYKNALGRVSQNWPFPLVDYWQATREPNPADFEFRRKP
jgi:4-hydroxyacetophenone monooxygenase